MEWKSSTYKNKYGDVIGEVKHHTLLEDGSITHYDVQFGNKLVKNIPSSMLEATEMQKHKHAIEKLKKDDEELNEMAFSDAHAGQNATKAIKQYADMLGKASQQIIKGMLESVKRSEFQPLDIQAALQRNKPAQAHGYEAQFISDLWLKIRDKFRKYTPKGKLRR